ncbi:MAG: ribosomal protein L7/L12 [Candidatus Nealsonbacteria bacterium]|nr:ribosomal protein L7/L12 [Candidatus Nealsonbacteria bacterium]
MPKCEFCGRSYPADAEACPGCGDKNANVERSPAADPSAEATELETRVLAELQTSGKIPAIKLYREETNAGLKEAKDAVEAFAGQHDIVATKSGCAGVLLLLIAIPAMVFAVFC